MELAPPGAALTGASRPARAGGQGSRSSTLWPYPAWDDEEGSGADKIRSEML